jgi:hypothetical protein
VIRPQGIRCHELAYKFQQKNPDWLLIHGELSMVGHLPFAWLELPSKSMIYVPELDKHFGVSDFLAVYNAWPRRKYSRTQAAKNKSLSGHFGPWKCIELHQNY